MNQVKTITEGEVLLTTVWYLLSRQALPFQLSVARGQGIEPGKIKDAVKRIFDGVTFEPQFVSSGPDIVAVSENEWWFVECKGVGAGKTSTQRNNFDRALASVVSYYDDLPNTLPSWAKNASVFLGLALPASRQYLNELQRRVRSPLRQWLNLWVLLYDESSKQINAIAPTESYS
jgi:hypothetical protein